VTTDRARERTPICVVCREPARYHSWVQGRPVCTGKCYGIAVMLALNARRIIRAHPAPHVPFDRSPMPMTEENARALERDMKGRSWAMRTRRPPVHGQRECGYCGMGIRRERDVLHVPYLGAFCSLTCATIANQGVIPEV
jgi:endogenous inhibitor of DNA gyrase (YacG/DUF329 family)